MKKCGWLVGALVAVGGCTTPLGYTNAPLQTLDRDTDYRIDARDGGFSVTIFHELYQFIPESDALVQSCKSAVLTIAHEHAENIGQPIRQINEQRIKLSIGRNGLSGMTSCTATAVAEFETAEALK